MLNLQPPYPAHSGGQIRRWEFLNYLAARHQVTLVYFSSSDHTKVPEPVQDLCEHAVAVPHPRTLSEQDLQIGRNAPGPVKWFGVSAMCRAIQECAPPTFDLVLVDTIFMTLYLELLPPRVVLLEQNIESRILKQYAQLNRTKLPATELALWDATWRMMEQYENRVWSRFPLRVVVSEQERQELVRRAPSGETIVVENGVNLDNYPLLPRANSRAVLFTGALDYFPNADAAHYLCKEILPHVWRAAPDLPVVIAGRNPPPDILALAEPPRLRVLANLKEMQNAASQAFLAVVPLRMGGGTRVKILEALAWGLPVVSTSTGCAGLEVADCRELLVRDDPNEFAEAILRLGSDPELYDSLRLNGRALVEQRYSWRTILEPLDAELAAYMPSLAGVTA
jgi:glycosyltransferase involved in cell wall biosynthesis